MTQTKLLSETGAHRIPTERLMASREELNAQSLESVRLRIYRKVAPIGMLAMLVLGLIDLYRGTMTPFQQIVHPLLICCLAVCALILSRKPALLHRIEMVCFGITAAYLLIQFYLMLMTPQVAGDRESYGNFVQWLPITYFLAFMLFPTRRQALTVSIAFLAAVLLPALLLFINEGLASFANPAFVSLLQIGFAHVIYIPLLTGIGMLKEQYVNATSLASTMAKVAAVDYLTGVANRRAVEYALRQALEQSRRYHHPLAVIILDIDWFKRVNDTFGHKAGDLVLSRVARLVRASLRTGDTLGRWGGEEFLIVCPETSPTQAVLLAERLRHLIEREQFIGSYNVTISLGIAAMQADDLADTLVQRADDALYRAKQNGRNRIELHELTQA